MSPRTGRPTVNPKKERLGIRVTEEQQRKLEECCRMTGKSKTEVISEGIEMVYESLKKG